MSDLALESHRVQRRFSPRLDPLWSGLFGFLLSFAGSWIPSIWRDEAATAYVANHSSQELFAIVGRIDGVFGLYYWLMHGWLSLVGTNPLTLRFPSAVAVGVGVAAVVAIGTRLHSRWLGLAAGLAFAVLPRMTAMGIEARSYAMCAAMVAVLGWLMLLLTERARILSAVPYVVVGVIAVYLHMYAVLAVGSLWLSGMLLSRTRRSRIVLSVATAGIFAVTVPLFLLARTQAAAQISWINTTPAQMFAQVFVEQFFPYKTVVRFTTPDQEWVRSLAVVLAGIAWILVAALLVTGWKRYRRALLFAVPGVVLPTVAVFVYSFLVSPAYTPKYLISTVPAFAVLLACALGNLPRFWLKATAVVLLAGIAAPIYVSQRQPNGKFVIDDFSFIAGTIDGHSTTGDGILFDDSPGDPIESGRNALSGYPASFRNVRDIAAVTGPERLTSPWSLQLPFDAVQDQVAGTSRVWLVTTPQKKPDAGADAAKLTHLGFHQAAQFAGPTHEVILWTR